MGKRKVVHYAILMILGVNLLSGFIPYEFNAKRITKPPVIDGYLDDKAWQEAAWVDKDFRSYDLDDPEYGKIAPVKTIMLFGYDDENLYVGAICVEPEVEKIRRYAKNQNRYYDMDLYDDDQVWVNVCPFTDRTDQYGFVVNPNGIHGTKFSIEITPGLYAENCLLENIIWYADAKVLDTCWTVEMQIPFQSLRFYSTYIEYMRIDVHRMRAREWNRCYRMCPYERDKLYTTYMAKMYINDWIAKPKKMEFLPYSLGGLELDTLSRSSLRFGLGARYYFNYENIVNLVLLPDFSQIETDIPQIDVNTTSALYYKEKRPFFLERKTFFETPIEVFYSRIVNNPLVAVKFAGSLKDYSFGYISAFERDAPFVLPFRERSFTIFSDKNGLCNVLRLKKSLLANTYLGLIATDRELEGGFNRVFGLDGAIGFWEKNTLRFMGISSWTREVFDTLLFNGYGIEFNGKTARFDGEEFMGKGMFIEFLHKRKNLNFRAYLEGLAPTFRADLGFINYNDYTKYGISINFPYRIKRYLIESITPQMRFEKRHTYFGSRTGIDRGASMNVQFSYLTSTQFSYQLVDKYYQNTWFNNMWSYSTSLSTSGIRNSNLGIDLNYSRAINYYSMPLSLGYSLYSSAWYDFHFGAVSFGLKYYWYLFWAERFREWIYDQKTFELNLSYAFSRFTNIRLICQYNSSTKNLLLSPLFSFTPTSLTLFYLGANHNFSNEAPFDLGAYDHIRSQIFLKIQYLFKH
ncbi:MAG: hypothetical protein ACUVQT_03290 [bacterium]